MVYIRQSKPVAALTEKLYAQLRMTKHISHQLPTLLCFDTSDHNYSKALMNINYRYSAEGYINVQLVKAKPLMFNNKRRIVLHSSLTEWAAIMR